jgi:hypothetical protein
MRKRMTINTEQVAEIEAARAKNKDKNVERRLLALLLYAQGAKRMEIEQRTGYSQNHIYDIASLYRDKGLPALVENHCGLQNMPAAHFSQHALACRGTTGT